MLFSPVSRMTVAARCYLASLAILMVLLLAVHFSIQVWGQQQARQWVSDWESQYGGHVEEVRLRMLRGALTLKQLTWQSDMAEVSVSKVLLRGDLVNALEQVQIRDIEMQGVKWVVRSKSTDIASMLPWHGLLDSVRHLKATGVDVELAVASLNDFPKLPLHIKKGIVSFDTKHGWHLTGKLLSGSIELQGKLNQWHLAYQKLEAEGLSAVLGLSPLTGHVSGGLDWRQGHVKAHTQWQSLGDRAGLLDWQGSILDKAVDLDFNLQDWPLQCFQKYMPEVKDRVFSEAYAQGEMNIKGSKLGWKILSPQLKIQDLSYKLVLPTAVEDADWSIQNMMLQQASLSWPQRRLYAKELSLQGGVLGWKKAPELALQKAASDWQVKLPVIKFKAMKMGDVSNNFWLESMFGKAAWLPPYIKLDAQSESELMGQWRIRVSGRLKHKPLQLKVQASDVPLLAMRDYLPVVLSQGSGLDGLLALNLRGQLANDGWKLGGDMRLAEVAWNRGSWLWRAKKMHLQDVALASNQTVRVKLWQVDDWSGQTSLQPLLQQPDAQVVVPDTWPWELGQWQVEHLNLGSGVFSLGQRRHVWFESDQLSVKGISSGQVLDVDVHGRLADGKFSFRGKWFPWGDVPWWSGKALVQNALPFAAIPWLKASELPVLTQGRISLAMNLKHDAELASQYRGDMQIQVSHAALQSGGFSNDVWMEWMDYGPHPLFERIASEGSFQLSIPMQGAWRSEALNWSRLGGHVLMALKQQPLASPKPLLQKLTISNIRLHDVKKDSLKYNERVRLRKVMHDLWRNKSWYLELRPQLGSSLLDRDLVQRVRATQEKIESFLNRRGVSRQRIFPVWPNESQRSGESTGILIQAVQP
ncbi:MAG: hypothetical protein R8K49_08975 [Mariprofundaceae bacterium]